MKRKMEEQIVEIPNLMDTTNWHLCVGKGSPFAEMLPRLNALVADMERDGRLDELRDAIFDRYR